MRTRQSGIPAAGKAAAATAKRKKSTQPKTKRGRGRGDVGREVIISATRQLLRETPPSGLSRKNVAVAAGVDPALVRYYFSDLEHLLAEILKQMVGEFHEQSAKTTRDPDQPLESIMNRVRFLVGFHSREPSFHELFVELILQGKDDWARRTREEFTGKYFAIFEAFIEGGRARGLIRDGFDPRFFYIAVIGAAAFLNGSGGVFNLLFGEDAQTEKYAERYASFLVELMKSGIALKDE